MQSAQVAVTSSTVTGSQHRAAHAACTLLHASAGFMKDGALRRDESQARRSGAWMVKLQERRWATPSVKYVVRLPNSSQNLLRLRQG
jgi:hypothetical protein